MGLTGLLDHGTSGEIEPIVVAEGARGRGVGTALIRHAAADAEKRGFEYVALRPVARNLSAIQMFHATGFRTLGAHIDLTMDLRERRHRWHGEVQLHDRPFQY